MSVAVSSFMEAPIGRFALPRLTAGASKRVGKTTTVRVLRTQPAEARIPSQRYYWHPAWQAGEREADHDLSTGRYRDFDDVEDLFAYLRA